MVFNQSEVAVNGSDVMIPRAAYAIRCTKAEPKESNKNKNKMIVISGEIISYNGQTEVIDPVTNNKISIAGLFVKSHWMLTKEGIGNVFQAFRVLGHQVDSIDTENPDCKWMEGLVFLALVECQKQVKKDQFGNEVLLPDGTKVEQISRGFWPNDVLGVVSSVGF